MGFPWSTVDEFRDFVGTLNESGRCDAVLARFTLAPLIRFEVPLTGGIKIYNVFDWGTSVTSDHDRVARLRLVLYPIQRSIGFVISSGR